MSRPTIDYLNARRASKPANGGKVYSREVRYAEDDNIRVLQRLSDNGLRTAIETVGGVRALASLLGLNPQSIYQWRRVPAERVVQIETVTDVPRNVLRPDLYEAWAPYEQESGKVTTRWQWAQIQKLGRAARWRKLSKKQRSEIMRAVRSRTDRTLRPAPIQSNSCKAGIAAGRFPANDEMMRRDQTEE
jgi:DNA-binding transcriptional regulator YdaS (Cro superfamily)